MRWIPVLIVLVIAGCKSAGDAPDVSTIKTEVTVQRFDRDFFALDTASMQASLQAVEKKYPQFLPLYFKYFAPVREIAAQNGTTFDSGLVVYYRFIKPLADSAAKAFPDLKDIQEELSENLRYVKHYYPSFVTPQVIASVEGFNPNDPTEIFGTTYYENKLVISLQMFLGKDYSGYDPSLYPDYLRRRFVPAFIVPNSLRAIANELYPDSSQSASLIEQMIEKGKQWWLLKKFLPNTPDSLITGYTAQQTADIEREEENIWGTIAQNENLFSVDPVTIQNYIGEAPFTQTLPQGAPGNIGPWIGWRIVQHFAEKNGKLTLQEVLHTSAKRIYEGAGYRGK